MKNEIDLNAIYGKFRTEPVTITPYGNGHINDTYCIKNEKVVLQRINTSVFTDPVKLMENIRAVTEYIRERLKENNEDPDTGTLTIIQTVDGKDYYKYDEDHYFRMYKFIDQSRTIENDKTYEELKNAGIGFGKFHKILADFPADQLHETIKDFHNTPKRVEALEEAIRADLAGRREKVDEEIRFARSYYNIADVVLNGIKAGNIPLRVTHNDTKINNILFAMESSKALCVIDLDTVMPGSLLYDFGDALRMGGSTAAEDETNLKKVHFDVKAFQSFAIGYLSEMKDFMTEEEIKLLPFSVKLLTYECGIRFLTDYLNGDTYFKIHRPDHNLERTRNQFQLVKELDELEGQLMAVVKELI